MNGTTYYYKIVSIDNDGTRETFERMAEATPMAPVTGFAISGNYPNPFSVAENGRTTITYTVGSASEQMELVVTDLLGHVVRTLVSGSADHAGSFSAEWDGRDMSGATVASGTYLVTLHATIADGRSTTATAKIVLTK